MKKLFSIVFLIAVIIITVIAAESCFYNGGLTFDNILDAGEIVYLAPLTLLQMVDQRKVLMGANEKLIKDGKDGFRQLDGDELKTFDGNVIKMKDLDAQITRVNSITEKRVDPITGPVPQMQERFSLMRVIRNLANGAQMHDADAIVVEQGKRDMLKGGVSPEGSICLPMVDHRHEKRADILAGTATAGEEIVSTDVLNLLGPLRNALVFSKVGATFLTGLVGNVDVPKYAGSTAGWKTEVEASADAAGAHSDLPLVPCRITGHLDISKRYLIQDAAGAEELLKTDLIAAVSGLLETTALGKIAASAGTNPAGLLPDDSDTFAGAVLGWGNVVDIEAAVDAANALEGNLAYVTHPSLRGIMKQTVRVGTTDSRMIMEGNELNGYPCHATSNMSSVLHTTNDEYGLAFANWRHFVIAQWGGIDLIVDPYSLASEAQVRIVVNSYWDFLFRHPLALAFGTSLLTDAA